MYKIVLSPRGSIGGLSLPNLNMKHNNKRGFHQILRMSSPSEQV